MNKKEAAVWLFCRRFFLCLPLLLMAVERVLPQSTTTDRAAARPWKFAVFCDGRANRTNDPGSANGVRWASITALAAHAASQQASLVVFPGDLANGTTNFGTLLQQWNEWKKDMAPLYNAGIPVYLTRGNHEIAQPDSIESWTRFFSELPRNGPEGQKGLTYKVETNNACFIGFDQYAGRSKTFDKTKYDSTVNSGMVSPWVIDQIKNTTRPWIFVFSHEAAFIGNSTDCMANAPAERDQLWDALGERGGVYLCGHDHLYVRREAPDAGNHPVLELVVGCAGAPPNPYTNAYLNGKYDRHVVPTDRFVNARGEAGRNTGHHPMYFGYVLVTVYPDRLEGEWWALTNYDTTDLASSIPPAKPQFEKLDSFIWPHR